MSDSSREANSAKDQLGPEPEAWAAYQYRVAQTHCGGCLPYHAFWGYVQLAGLRSNSLLRYQEKLAELIGEHAPRGAHILVAGAADAASLALVADATKERAVSIKVADVCATPLEVCRAYSERHGLYASTETVDLARTLPQGSYDLIFAHIVLMFIARERRVDFLRNLNLSLAPEGRLLFMHRPRSRKATTNPNSEAQAFAGKTIAALKAQGISLPDEEGRFGQGLEAYWIGRQARDDNPVPIEEAETCLAAAGFHVEARFDDHRDPLKTQNGTRSGAASTHMFIASRVCDGKV